VRMLESLDWDRHRALAAKHKWSRRKLPIFYSI